MSETKLTGIEREPIDSPDFPEVGYDGFTKVIEIKLKDGSVKQVQGVTHPHWAQISTGDIHAHLHAILANPGAFQQRDA